MQVICSYCARPAELVTGVEIYPHRKDLRDINFWRCLPCEAYTGCHAAGSFKTVNNIRVYHDGTEPKGTLAKKDLRELRISVHKILDEYWLHSENRRGQRKKVYKRLARDLGLPVDECHTGMFDREMCGIAIAAIMKWGE